MVTLEMKGLGIFVAAVRNKKIPRRNQKLVLYINLGFRERNNKNVLFFTVDALHKESLCVACWPGGFFKMGRTNL